jgi:hypothetical protein
MMMGLSPAGTALNLGGDRGLGGQLSDQVATETEDERKKRLMGLSALQSPAGKALLAGSVF